MDDLFDLMEGEVLGIEEFPEEEQRKHFSRLPLGEWEHPECLSWLSTLCPEKIGVKYAPSTEDGASKEDGTTGLTGPLLLEALDSVRELKETFGLRSMGQRLAFERALREVEQMAGKHSAPAAAKLLLSRPRGAAGGVFDEAFLKATASTYDMHMGTENMGPMLYALVRFVKPQVVMEVGAGYTTLFVLQALKDNYVELQNYRMLNALGECHVQSNGGTQPWCLPSFLEKEVQPGLLLCVDNMNHRYTTAHKVLEAAEALGLEEHLRLKVCDAFKFHETMEDGPLIDLLWVDFGAGEELGGFMESYWNRVNPKGGFVAVHSTLTNSVTRQWLRGMTATLQSQEKTGETAADSPTKKESGFAWGEYKELSFLEPHKLFQNSFTILQRRQGWTEPLYTKYP